MGNGNRAPARERCPKRSSRPAGMSAQAIIDRLNWLSQQGVTVSAVPIPAVRGVDEYLDYAQWVIEEIKPNVS